MAQTRTETDSFGPLEVPADKYWGAQTQRSIQNFPIGWEKQPVAIVRALGVIKKACAEVNKATGQARREARPTRSIAAASEVIDGKFDDNFPLVVWQTGSGTQSNMNANEVISNRAIEILGGEIGSKKPVHPNDHVQHGAVLERHLPHRHARRRRDDGARRAAAGAEEAARGARGEVGRVQGHHQDRPHPHAGRHAADAGPGILGLRACRSEGHRAGRAVPARTSTSWRRAAPPSAPGSTPEAGWAETVAANIAEITGLPFVTAPNKFEALAAHDAMVVMSGALKHGRGLAVQDRQRHPPARLRPPLGPRRADPARERAGLLDHAGQGEPDAGRGADAGLRACHGQRRGDRASPAPRAISS